ncbi:MAG: pyruvate kinase, partial [Candidatus Azambacteria bacterium]|nr:pyruvate kinase [Candidatus Azambacteria bacterium]
ELIPGETFTLTTDHIEGDEKRVSIQYKNFPKEVKNGHIIYIHDGRRKLEVVKIKGNDVICKVIVGGNIKGRRGVNLPDSELSIGSLTKKDMHDLEFGLKYDVDFIALSFVRRAEDVVKLREILKKRGSQARIIAKIETPQAIQNIDEIISKADGVMVARGDLAIEVPAERVPLIQKMIIEKCNNLGKPVITATQMLESMIKNPVPTRAEVSDVANAILDGTDAIMLSEETALGDYPVEAVRMMSKIAHEIEKKYPERMIMRSGDNGASDITDSITGSVVKAAYDVGAKVIVALTDSGFTARMISRYKPGPVILALSPNEKTYNQLHLSFGCLPARIKRYKTLQEASMLVRQCCLKEKIASPGDRIVIACGAPYNKKGGATNMILVETI